MKSEYFCPRNRQRGAFVSAGLDFLSEAGIEAKDLLRTCQDDQVSSDRRGLACLAAGYLGFRPAIPTLITLCGGESIELAINAARALGAIGSYRATRPLLAILRTTTQEAVWGTVASTLGELCDRRAEAYLRHALINGTETQRYWSAEALRGLAGSPRSMRALEKALKDHSPLVRSAALDTLGIIGGRESIPLILERLEDQEVVPHVPDDPTVSSAAANALENIRNRFFG